MAGLTVAVIIPTYNRAHLVCEAIDSCLAQTRIPDEIIVVDDGSTDNTQTVLAKYSAPVIVVRQENAGLSSARNTGINHATSDLIAFLDDDDTLTKNSIEIRATFLENNTEYGVVYGDVLLTDLAGHPQGRFSLISGIIAPSGNVFAEYAQRNIRPVHAFMIRQSCVDKIGFFDPRLTVLEDYDFWLRASVHYHFGYIEEVFGNYRYHVNRMTAQQRRKMQENEVIVRARIFNTSAFSRLTPTQKARVYSVHATQHMLLGDGAIARQWYIKAIRTAPWLLRPYALLGLTLFGKRGFNLVSSLKGLLRKVS